MAVTRIAAQTARLRNLCLDDSAMPEQRLRNARKLLKIAASERNVPIVKRVIAAFELITDPKIAGRVRRLKVQLQRAVDEAYKAAKSKRDAQALSPGVIGGVDLLPPDSEDAFWDDQSGGTSGRERFSIAWRLPDDITREQIVASLASDPERLEAHVTRRQLWACSAAELDALFAQNTAEFKQLFAALGREYSPETIDELASSLRPPFLEFKPAQSKTDLPAIGLTESGQLIENIEFIKSWPHQRASHNPI